MATWADIQTHMRSQYRLQSDEPSVVSMTWEYEDGRHQRLIVRRIEMNDRDLIELKSPFALLGGPDPVELLRENARLPLGAVALSGEVYLLMHNVDAGCISLAELDDLLTRVARLADQLERKHGARDEF